MSGEEEKRAIKVELTAETKALLDEIVQQVSALTAAALKSVTQVRRWSVASVIISVIALAAVCWHLLTTCPSFGEWFAGLFGG